MVSIGDSYVEAEAAVDLAAWPRHRCATGMADGKMGRPRVWLRMLSDGLMICQGGLRDGLNV